MMGKTKAHMEINRTMRKKSTVIPLGPLVISIASMNDEKIIAYPQINATSALAIMICLSVPPETTRHRQGMREKYPMETAMKRQEKKLKMRYCGGERTAYIAPVPKPHRVV